MPDIRFIVLNDTQAATVRGETANGSALAPRLMDNAPAMAMAGSPYTSYSNGHYHVLPYAVLLDPDHAMWHSYLMALPERVLATQTIFLPVED